MKISTGKTAGRATFAVFGGIALFGSTNAATAQKISRGPVISPSIIAAHRLKYYPPRGWIRHYLGDDRYKVGSVWRVVTTPNDKFYYPPFAREMLMAPPDRIIGFASAQDAQEAGYAPASQYGGAFGLDVHQMAVADARDNPEPVAVPVAKSSAPNSNPTVVNRSNRAQRVLLSDGVSSVLLPPNWKRTRSFVQNNVGNTREISDDFQSLRGGGVLEFSTFEFPAALAKQMSMGKMKQVMIGVGNGKFVVRDTSLGGLPAMVVTDKYGGDLPVGMGKKSVMAMRGNKSYALSYMGSKNIPGAASIINSFRPR